LEARHLPSHDNPGSSWRSQAELRMGHRRSTSRTSCCTAGFGVSALRIAPTISASVRPLCRMLWISARGP
jgi:hypothetical protein